MYFLILMATLVVYGSSMPQGETKPPPGIPGGPEPGSPGNGGHGAPLESPTKPGAGNDGSLICVCRPAPGGAKDSFTCKCNPTLAGAINPATPIGSGGKDVNVQVPPGPPPPPGSDGVGLPPNAILPGIGPVGPPPKSENPANPNPNGTNAAPQPSISGNATQPSAGNNPVPQPASAIVAGTSKAAAQSSGTTDSAFGDTWSYVMCAKRSNSRKPDWTWLVDDNGKSIQVNGKWLKYSCTYGTVTPMLIQTSVYTDIANQCKSKGYELAQPADSFHSDWYPFQIDQTLTEYFRLNTVLGFATSYDRRIQSPIDKC